MREYATIIESPVGLVRITATERGVGSVNFVENANVRGDDDGPDVLRRCVSQLREYFEGKRRTFDALPLLLRGTDFQSRVWDETLDVPYGKTSTYGALAARLDGAAAQAVGQALTRNPICLIVPCHRIVAADGQGGYAGGLWRKEWLLKHEGAALSA